MADTHYPEARGVTDIRRLGRGKRRGLAALAGALVAGGAIGLAPSHASATGPTTTCTLQSRVNPTEAGTTASFRFFANSEDSLPPGPIGAVTFLDDGVPFRVAVPLIPDGFSLDHSSIIVETAGLSPGRHTISAVYLPLPPSTPCPNGIPTVVHEVRSTASTTSVTSSVNPTVFGQSATFNATVTKVGGTPTGTVQFQVDGNPSGGPVPLDGGGNASLTRSDLAVGAHSVSAVYASDSPGTRNSEGSLEGGQRVDAAATSTTVTAAPNPAEVEVDVTLSAAVAVIPPGAGTPGGTVQFSADGNPVGPPVALGPGGTATTATSTLAIGNRTIGAAYSGDANFQPSSGSTTEIIERARTALTYTGATTGDFHDPAVLSATLTRQRDGAGIAGATVNLSVGTQGCSATTDSAGRSACTVTPAEAAGPSTVRASYAGDAHFQPAGTSAAFMITREQTSLRLTSGAVTLAGAPFVASGVLTEDDGAPVLAGRPVTFSLGTQTCTGNTDASGRAQCTIPTTSQPLGPVTLTATFGQDDYYLGSTANASVIVYAFPSSGAFAIGDQTAVVGSTVLFFGSDWDKTNPTSGGAAPSSFKGFSLAPGSPISCGGSFIASTGNSDKPPASVPSYMGTIVTSKVTQDGSTVAGTRAQLVVVRTTSYGTSPGKGGRGTVVATIPC